MRKLFERYRFDNIAIITLFVFVLLTSITSFNIGLNVDTNAGFIYRLIILILLGIFATVSSVLVSVKNKYISIMFYIMAFIYFISNTLTVFLIKDSNLNISLLTRFEGLSQIIINIIIAYFLIAFQKETFSLHVSRYILISIIAFAVIAILYSCFFQMDVIINSFAAEHATLYQVNSFFTDKNVFGTFLFFGFCATVFLAFLEKKNWIYFALIPIIAFLIISRAKTPLLIALLIGIAVFVYYAIITFKAHKKSWLITFVVLGTIVLIFMIIFLIGFNENSIFHQFNYYLTHSLIEDGITTMNERFDKWSSITHKLFETNYVLAGYGERTYMSFLNYYVGHGSVVSADNVIITEILQGGIIKLILYISLFIVLIYRGLKLIDNKIFKWFYLGFAIALIIYSLMEDIEIIGTRGYSLLAGSLLAFIPSFYISYKGKICYDTSSINSNLQ